MPSAIHIDGSKLESRSETQLDDFHRMIKDICQLVDAAPGNNFSDIDKMPIIQKMDDYKSDPREWAKYAYKDEKQCFTRNMVDRGNGKCNALILVWSPGKESPVHDHAGSHCVMKILQGVLKETQFKWPERKLVDKDQSSPLQTQRILEFHRDEVTYISDDHGLHKISNLDPETFAVSLHLYAPPNAEKHGCQVFHEKTGVGVHVAKYDLYSEMAVLKEN